MIDPLAKKIHIKPGTLLKSSAYRNKNQTWFLFLGTGDFTKESSLFAGLEIVWHNPSGIPVVVIKNSSEIYYSRVKSIFSEDAIYEPIEKELL